MNVVSVFAPAFVMNGSMTADKVVDDINKNPDKYKDVSYVIENMQSGDLAKGIEESLHDHGINATRVSFTNFPYSVPDTATMADVLNYNKHLVLGQSSVATPTAIPMDACRCHACPVGIEVVIAGLMIGTIMVLRKTDR